MVLTGEQLDLALFVEVRTDLAAELAHRDIDVCAPGATDRPASALVTLSATDATVSIELDDRVTHKRVGRDLTLERLPANGRALAIAIAIDELLRASWAELSLRRDEPSGEPEPEEPRPDYTRRTVNARGAHGSYVPPPAPYALSAELGYLHTQHDFDAFSLGARLTMRPWRRGWFALGLAGLASLPADSQLGKAIASGLRGTLTAGLCSRDRGHVFACGGARGEVDLLALRGIAPQDARTHSELASVVQLGAVGMLGVPLADGRALFTELTLGGVLVGAEASDTQRVIMGVTGLMIGVNLGLEFEL